MRVEHCASYANCSSCLEARDPYCGWCSLEKRYLPILHKRIITDIKNKKKSHPADWIAVQPVAVLYNWGDFQQIYDRFNFSLRWLKERKGYPSISIRILQSTLKCHWICHHFGDWSCLHSKESGLHFFDITPCVGFRSDRHQTPIIRPECCQIWKSWSFLPIKAE